LCPGELLARYGVPGILFNPYTSLSGEEAPHFGPSGAQIPVKGGVPFKRAFLFGAHAVGKYWGHLMSGHIRKKFVGGHLLKMS